MKDLTRKANGFVEIDEPLRADADGLVRCRVCGCTETDPCNPPCGWKKGPRFGVREDLCTTCDEAAEVLHRWADAARRPNRSALFREVRRRK